MKIIQLSLVFGLFPFAVWAQHPNKLIRDGNKLYNDSNFAAAQEKYLKSIEKNSNNLKSAFNLGDVLYKQKKWDEAKQQFSILAQTSSDKEIKSKSFHNLGNIHLENKAYEDAVKAYKEALKINPKDEETRYNLAFATDKLKKEQNKQNQDNKQDQQNKENQDKQQDNKQNQQDQQQKQDEQQNEQQNNQDKDKQQEQKQQPQNQLSKEEAKRLLEAMQNEEKNVQDKLKRQKAGVKVKSDKDW
jgi:hypothetical protein